MRKKVSFVLSMLLVASLAAGCGSKKNDETPAADSTTAEKADTAETDGNETEPAQDDAAAGGALKTGFAAITGIASSKEPGAEGDGTAQADSTIAAVTVDENGVITNCILDGVQTKINFSAEGKVTTPLDTTVDSKNVLGEGYGMKAASGIGKEWNEQAQAFADYCIGKTADEVAGIAVTEGLASDEDLKASVTVHIGDFMAAVQKAAANAADLGAKAGDKLGLYTSTSIASSKDASADAEGLAQANSTYSVVTVDGDGKITSCLIDSTQSNVNFDAAGKITSDLTAAVSTKNELGEGYGMKAASGIGKEWNEQAAAFAAYCVGKTADEVKGIAVNEGLAADEDLLASVTIHVTDFMSVVSNAVASAK